jgi:non-ribosomal peptide synthetase component F
VIGFFLNTLVLRTNLSGKPSFREVLKRVREVALGAYAHQDLPFEKLVEEMDVARDTGRQPLFQVMFAMQNAQPMTLTMPGLKLEETVDNETATAKFDLNLFVAENPEGLEGTLEYSTDLFEAATIKRLMGHFEELLQAVVNDPTTSVTQLRLLSEAEEQRLLELPGTGRKREPAGALSDRSRSGTRDAGWDRIGTVGGDVCGAAGGAEDRRGVSAAGSVVPGRASEVHVRGRATEVVADGATVGAASEWM